MKRRNTRYITPLETAALFGNSERTVLTWCRDQTIIARRDDNGRSWLVDRLANAKHFEDRQPAVARAFKNARPLAKHERAALRARRGRAAKKTSVLALGALPAPLAASIMGEAPHVIRRALRRDDARGIEAIQLPSGRRLVDVRGLIGRRLPDCGLEMSTRVREGEITMVQAMVRAGVDLAPDDIELLAA